MKKRINLAFFSYSRSEFGNINELLKGLKNIKNLITMFIYQEHIFQINMEIQ